MSVIPCTGYYMSTLTKSGTLKKENLGDISSTSIIEETKIDLGKAEEVENRKASQQEDNVIFANLQTSTLEDTQETQEKVALDESIIEETKIDLGKVEEVEKASQQEDNGANLHTSTLEDTQETPDTQEKVALDENKNEHSS